MFVRTLNALHGDVFGFCDCHLYKMFHLVKGDVIKKSDLSRCRFFLFWLYCIYGN